MYCKDILNENADLPIVRESILDINGKLINIECTGSRIVYRGENAVISLIRNISQKKQLEKLKRSSEQKERLLKETLECDRLRGEFFANISHELRTPINVILSSIQMFELYHNRDYQDPLIERKLKYIGIMKQNCYRLLRLVNNLIDITKIDADFFEIELKNENIVPIVENITMSVSEYIKEKGMSLIFDTEVEDKIIACNPDSIERIILNLLSNAIKFTNSGGDIFVNIYDKEKYIIISVKDTGVGIPQNKLETIFERFTQVDKSLTRDHEGSGIGLSLVKSLVEKHGGKIYVESKCGMGSEFFIQLPVNALEDDTYTQDYSQIFEKRNFVERIYIEFSDIYK